MGNGKEKRRVAYIRSRPEWYGHNVNDMFFRQSDWIFVPVQDLSEEQRLFEYERAFYFFVSGYGNSEEAIKANSAGCVLIGARADVPNDIPIIQCSEWDPTDAFLTFLFVELIRKIFPLALKPKTANLTNLLFGFFRTVLRPIMKVFYLCRAAAVTWKNQGTRHVFIKTRNYFRKAMHI